MLFVLLHDLSRFLLKCVFDGIPFIIFEVCALLLQVMQSPPSLHISLLFIFDMIKSALYEVYATFRPFQSLLSTIYRRVRPLRDLICMIGPNRAVLVSEGHPRVQLDPLL